MSSDSTITVAKGRNSSYEYSESDLLKKSVQSKIYYAKDIKNSRKVVLKFLLINDEQKFNIEKKALETLMFKRSFKHIIEIFDILEIQNGEERWLIIVMEEYEENFQENYFEKYIEKDEFQKMKLCLQLSYGIFEMHLIGYMVTNFSPSSICYFQNGENFKIYDMEELRNQENANLKIQPMQNSFYLAPEVLKGEFINQKADIWSLGLVIYELLANQKFALDNQLFEEKLQQEQINNKLNEAKINDEIRKLLKQMLMINPLNRLNIDLVIVKNLCNNLYELEIILKIFKSNYETEIDQLYTQYLPILTNQSNCLLCFNNNCFSREMSQFNDALSFYDECIKLNPLQINFYSKKGECLRAKQRYNDAISCYEQCIRLDPQEFNYYNLIGECLQLLDRFEDAIKFYDKCIKEHPEQTHLFLEKGDCLHYLERYEQAIDCYENCIKLFPEETIYYSKKSLCLQLLGQYEDVINFYDDCIKLYPQKQAFFAEKASCLIILEKFSEAINCYDECLKIGPKSAQYFSKKGDCLLKLNNIKEAINCFDQCIELYPKESSSYEKKGDCLKQLGIYHDAIQQYDRCIQLDPQQYLSYTKKSECLLLQGLFMNAQATLHKGILMFPHQNYLFFTKSYSLGKVQLAREAIISIRLYKTQHSNRYDSGEHAIRNKF